MKLLKRMLLLALLLVVCSVSIAAEDPCEPTKPQLQFKISDEAQNLETGLEEDLMIPRPTHVAYLGLKNVSKIQLVNPWTNIKKVARGEWLEGRRSFWHVRFKGEGVSGKPSEFMLLLKWHERPRPGWSEFWLFASSEQEARKLTEAFIWHIERLADVEVRIEETELEVYREDVVRLEKEKQKIEQELPGAKSEFKELKKTTYYRNQDDAEKSILEWNTLLNTVEVDIVGIKARLMKIKELKENGYGSRLRIMRAAAEVDLAGALARQIAAQSHREKALRFIYLTGKLQGEGALIIYNEELPRLRKVIKEFEDKLPKMRAAIKPVEVVGNEVTIYPVR